ncbi:MAG: hypothetical protein QOJ80_3374, partial [Mycobacterium sp.]|nr:hypothetical protein [Mycobacterium sp.]
MTTLSSQSAAVDAEVPASYPPAAAFAEDANA